MTAETEDNRTQHLDQLVDVVIAARLAGEELSDEAVIAAHPDLMPELAEKLRALAAVQQGRAAAQRAAEPATGSAARGASEDAGAIHDSTQAVGHSPGTGVRRPGRGTSDSFPGYEILHEIHRGGQGVVYQAIQRTTRRKVAIKVLHAGPLAGPRQRARFEREVQILGALNHPNIVAIHDSGTAPGGGLYYVMDYVRGMRLRDYVRGNRLTLEQTLALFVTICDAVQHAHQKGIIHRDLKPSNILVDADGNPKLVDFGFGKLLAAPADAVVSLTQDIMGTLAYMSPEQTRGNPDEIDTRTDIYALGVVLYELLTGSFPYPVVGEMADVLRHISQTQPSPPERQWTRTSGVTAGSGRRWRRSRCPIDDDVQTVVLKCLSKERERRYQSAGELADDLRHYLTGKPIAAKRDSGWYVLRKLLFRNVKVGATVVLVAVILLSCIAIGGYFYGESRHAARERDAKASVAADRARELSALSEDTRRELRRYAFGWFLAEWYAGRVERARTIREECFRNTPEYAVAGFLLDDQYPLEKLLGELTNAAEPLAWLAAGERHLKAGRGAEAAKSFESVGQARGDAWLAAAAQARLEQLRPKLGESAANEGQP